MSNQNVDAATTRGSTPRPPVARPDAPGDPTGGDHSAGHGQTSRPDGARGRRTLNVVGHGGIYFLVDPDTDYTRGTMLDEGGGWWRCVTPSGRVRRIYVPDETPDPPLAAAERIGGS